jgi:glucoamylase
MVHWSADGWTTSQDVRDFDSGFGVYAIDLPTEKLPAGREVVLTFYWPDEGRWEGKDYSIKIE